MIPMNEPPDEAQDAQATQEARQSAPPIDNRFLFVDVAAMRAKQLRRGAELRLDEPETSANGVPIAPRPVKNERLAMEEVRRGLVPYQVPELKPARQ
jgi:DNA-directed RNA polymerase subunit K/omega